MVMNYLPEISFLLRAVVKFRVKGSERHRQVSYHIGDLAAHEGTRSLGISTTTTDRCDTSMGFNG